MPQRSRQTCPDRNQSLHDIGILCRKTAIRSEPVIVFTNSTSLFYQWARCKTFLPGYYEGLLQRDADSRKPCSCSTRTRFTKMYNWKSDSVLLWHPRRWHEVGGGLFRGLGRSKRSDRKSLPMLLASEAAPAVRGVPRRRLLSFGGS